MYSQKCRYLQLIELHDGKMPDSIILHLEKLLRLLRLNLPECERLNSDRALTSASKCPKEQAVIMCDLQATFSFSIGSLYC